MPEDIYTIVKLHICVGVFLLVVAANASDPCETFQPIPDLLRRDAAYSLSEGEEPINDRELVEDWYGDINYKLLDEPPGFFQCGGFFPMWRQSSTDESATICMETNSDNCSETFDIEMKTCSGYEVYFLKKAPTHRASYCLANNTDDPPQFLVTPYINVDLHHEKFVSKLLFQCNFPPSEEDLFYTTIWYVEGAPVYTFPSLQWTNDTQDYILATTLTEDLLRENGVTKGGINIQCAVRAQYHINGAFSESELSRNQFVGVKIHHWDREMAEGETQHLYMEMSVPFGCGTFLPSVGQKCYFNVEVVTVENPEDCSSAAVVENSCGIEPFESDNWQEGSHLAFVGKITSMYGETSGTTHLKLKTPSNVGELSKFWEDYNIGHITIQIVKNTSAITYKYCSMNNDPYLLTFDYTWSSLDNEGVYLFYQDESRHIEVQVETEICSPEDFWGEIPPFCTCGIAVRAGRTVFEISHCDTPVWQIGYTACGDGGDVLIVRRNGNQYVITLPTGVSVEVYVNMWDTHFISVNLYPTALDEGKVRGLCGVLSGIQEDDWTMRNGEVTDVFEDFTESWRIPKEESLFNPDVIESGLGSYEPVYQFCTCDESTPDKQITCSAMAASEVCQNPAGFDKVEQRDCLISKRKKRMAQPQLKRRKRSNKEHIWPNGWNESSATAYCESKFAESPTVHLLKDVPSVDTDAPMKACVADIRASGSNIFSSAAVSSVGMQARREAMVDPVLAEPDPDNPSAPTIFDVITLQTCPGDCSGHGSCSAGRCQCESGYGGGDCSADETRPPLLVHVADDGVCDLASKDCLSVSVLGEIFIGSEESTCQMKKYLVLASGEKSAVETTTSRSTFESISEVFCALPELSEDDVVVSYSVSVSHAGDVFSNELDLLVYDSSCVNVDHDKGVPTLQSGYCVYKGRCSAEGDARYDNPCVKCFIKYGIPTWQHITENGCSNENPYPGGNAASRESMPTILLFAIMIIQITLSQLSRSNFDLNVSCVRLLASA